MGTRYCRSSATWSSRQPATADMLPGKCVMSEHARISQHLIVTNYAMTTLLISRSVTSVHRRCIDSVATSKSSPHCSYTTPSREQSRRLRARLLAGAKSLVGVHAALIPRHSLLNRPNGRAYAAEASAFSEHIHTLAMFGLAVATCM